MEQIREDTHIQSIDFYKGGNIKQRKNCSKGSPPPELVGKIKPGAEAIYLYEANELRSLTYTIYKD